MRRPARSTALLAVVAVVCLTLAVPVFRSGVTAHPFPAYVAGEPGYLVDRYLGSRIAVALALGGLGAVLAVVALGRMLQAMTALPDRRPAQEPIPDVVRV